MQPYLRDLRQNLQPPIKRTASHTHDTLQRKTVRVRRVRSIVFPEIPPQSAHKGRAFQRAGFSVQVVRQGVQPGVQFGETLREIASRM